MESLAEIWKAVDGYEGLYEVSNTGKVRSLYRYKRTLKPIISNSGYERVDLFKNKTRKQFSVHRLVACAFVNNPDNKPFVNHKDENKTNNHSNNLEWVTPEENCVYGTAIIRRTLNTDYSKRRNNSANQIKACSKPILQYTKDGVFVKAWSSASECSRKTGFSISGIRSVVKKQRNSIFGYIFKEGSDDLSHE